MAIRVKTLWTARKRKACKSDPKWGRREQPGARKLGLTLGRTLRRRMCGIVAPFQKMNMRIVLTKPKPLEFMPADSNL